MNIMPKLDVVQLMTMGIVYKDKYLVNTKKTYV